MRLRRSLTLGSVFVLLATVLVVPGTQAAQEKGRYIVVLKDAVSSPTVVAKSHGKKYEAQVGHVYKNTIKGYSAKLKKKDLAALQSDPKVAFVTQDGRATIAKKGGNKPPKDPPNQLPSDEDPSCGEIGSWGQDRIDQRSGRDGCYDPDGHGSGVTAYVLDTGVHLTHPDIAGRAVGGPDIVSGGTVTVDCHGHGTHVAATIGGTRYGVAQDVGIVGVRVLDCAGSGWWSGIIEGLEFVTGHDNGGKDKVANLSLSGPGNVAMDLAVAQAAEAGVTVVVAAGNDYRNACAYSPARAPDAITVGATNSSDRKASYSNFGSCVDLFAPGDRIVSALPPGGSGTKSGTSMASPHVAGVAAILLGRGTPPESVASAITSSATRGKIKARGSGSPNLLLYVD